MTYKNSNFLYLVLIIILLCILYLCKTNKNKSNINESYENISQTKTKYLYCLTEEDYNNLENHINYIEKIYNNINNIIATNNETYDNQLQLYINNLLILFQKLMSIPINCILNDKNQLEILNKIVKLLDKNKEKLRTIKILLMNKFNTNVHVADILPSKKILKLNTLNAFSNLFNNISYIFNDNHDYTIDDTNNIFDNRGNKIGKITNKEDLYKKISPNQHKECGFTCKQNTSYREPKLNEEPGYKHLKYNF